MTPKQLSARSYAAYERLDGMSMIDKAAVIDAMSVLYRHEMQTLAALPPPPTPIKDEES
jgi:hypothetical protein